RDTLYDELAPGRRVQLHRRVGDALEELYADNVEPHLAELAHHFYESARPDVAEKALAYARRAAERSLGLLAYEEAARLLAVALRVLDALGDEDSSLRVRLLARLAGGPLRDSTVDPVRRVSLGAQALEIARQIDEPSTLAYALLGYIASHHSPDFTTEQVELSKELI